jgi:hypothetical protein
MNFARKSVSLAALLLIAGSLLCAQKPRLTNAKVQEMSAASGLKPAVDSLVKQAGPLWIGYRIPAAAKERTMCCFDSWSDQGAKDSCCGCRMEGDKEHSFTGTSSNCSSPEPLPYAFVFLRSEAQKIQKVRVFSPECPLDFAGLPVYWMEDVNPGQSVELLTALVIGSESETVGKKDPLRQAVMAIAMHNIPEADQALEKLMQPSHPPKIREDVAFWIGVERGKKGLEILRKYAKSDPDDRVRDKLAFAFSQSKEPEAIQDLIGMARNDSSPHVRGQAIFWLAQIGGRKEAEMITSAIENDPETEVKKKAVFALSQMHDGNGVPLLINVVRTNKNPAVRKQAIFWLGQSKDPRALDFLEEIVTR